MSDALIPIPAAEQKPLAVIPPDVMEAANVVARWLAATYGVAVTVGEQTFHHPDTPSGGLVAVPVKDHRSALALEGHGGTLAVLGRWK